MSQPAWTWDEARRQYYIFVAAEGAFVYQDGTRVPLPGSSRVDQRAQPSIQPPPASGELVISDLSSLSLQPSYRSIRGVNPGTDRETFDTRYRVRRPGADFFVVGKVFRILWPEPLGSTANRASTRAGGEPSNVSQIAFNEEVHAKIAWFVVQSEDSASSQCLRIQTYGNQGVGKPDLEKSHHAIIHTTEEAPKPSAAEQPAKGEDGMLKPIRVVARSRGEKLHVMSRINFRKVYTVEHNVKVYDFGDIDEKHLTRFFRQYETVYAKCRTPHMTAGDEDSDREKLEGDNDEVNNDTPISGLAMHNLLVTQYVNYLRERRKGIRADELQNGSYWEQLEQYTALMLKGICPSDLVHTVLVQHYAHYMRQQGVTDAATSLEEAETKEEAAKCYAMLIRNKVPLPSWGST